MATGSNLQKFLIRFSAGAALLALVVACGGAPDSSISTQPTKSHQLSNVGLNLGQMSREDYVAVQEKWVGSKEPACNYFVTTALCQNDKCMESKPDMLAAEYGSYLKKNGWREIDLDTLEGLFNGDADFDVIMQSDGLKSTKHGHVLIPISLGANHKLTVAQAEMGTVTNEIVVEDDLKIMKFDGGMHIWVSE